jgi:hypothetical protein
MRRRASKNMTSSRSSSLGQRRLREGISGRDPLMAAIGESVHYETDEGTWLAIASGDTQAVRVFVPHRGPNEAEPDISLWWNGFVTPRVLRYWVADTIEVLNPSLECQIGIWANDAPEEAEGRRYRVGTVGKIERDIERWQDDGMVTCSIIDARGDRQVVYMWAELTGPHGKKGEGEVGIQYAPENLETTRGRHVFSRLLQKTATLRFSESDIGLLCKILAEKVIAHDTAVAAATV